MIEVIFQIRKDNFEAHEAVTSELDIVEENDQITHVISLDEIKDGEDILSMYIFFYYFTTCSQRKFYVKTQLF